MHLLLFLLFFQGSGFDAIKVGMKDTQVEKLVGLPIEIFRGFPEFTGLSVEEKGQLNYVCWRYKNIKKMILDTLDNEIKKDTLVIVQIDTTILINGWKQFDPDEIPKIIGDTAYTFRTPYYMSHRKMITKEDYEQAMLYSSEKSSYNCIPIKSRELKIDTITQIETIVTGVERYVRTLILNQCILFDPSSNRVTNKGFYPTKIDMKFISNKRWSKRK